LLVTRKRNISTILLYLPKIKLKTTKMKKLSIVLLAVFFIGIANVNAQTDVTTETPVAIEEVQSEDVAKTTCTKAQKEACKKDASKCCKKKSKSSCSKSKEGSFNFNKSNSYGDEKSSCSKKAKKGCSKSKASCSKAERKKGCCKKDAKKCAVDCTKPCCVPAPPVKE
jgi:hypothetical protein